VEGEAGDLNTALLDGREHLRREVEAGGGGGDRAGVAAVDGLVALLVGVGVGAVDVGRQGHVADAAECGKEVRDRGEFKQALAELAALENLGLENGFAGGAGEDEPLADGHLAAGADESAPAVARACGRSGEHDLDAAGGPLALADKGAVGKEARGDDAGVVEHEQVAGTELGGKRGEEAVVDGAGGAVEEHHAAGTADLGRGLRDEFLGEVVVEVGDAQG
jgi:hypothetical protein